MSMSESPDFIIDLHRIESSISIIDSSLKYSRPIVHTPIVFQMTTSGVATFCITKLLDDVIMAINPRLYVHLLLEMFFYRLRSNRNMAQVFENEQLLMKTYSLICQVTSPKIYDFDYDSCSKI
jgi:hypothetical protein